MRRAKFTDSKDQLSIFDMIDRLHHYDMPELHEGLLMESISSAFGMARGGKDRAASQECWEWIERENSGLPFSFEDCCQSIGADPDDLRALLQYHKKRLLSKGTH